MKSDQFGLNLSLSKFMILGLIFIDSGPYGGHKIVWLLLKILNYNAMNNYDSTKSFYLDK